MTPTLSRSGITLAAVSGSFVLAGALRGSWSLVALGLVQLAALMTLYLIMVPVAAALRGGNLDLSWWVAAPAGPQGAMVSGRPGLLKLRFSNRAERHIRRVLLTVLGSKRLRTGDPATVELAAGLASRLEMEVVATKPGTWFLHGVLFEAGDLFGLVCVQAYFPNPLGVRVLPPPLAVPRGAPPPRPALVPDRAGLRLHPRAGVGSDLRELRDHRPGDPFKRIAWKATSRAGKLIVRECEGETVVTRQVVLDISPTMREDTAVGTSKLDLAVVLASTVARMGVQGGERVGMVAFDTRVYSEVEAGDGATHLRRILEMLLDVQTVVDEDLTDLTDAELFSAVSAYLAYQGGGDVRVNRGSDGERDTLVGHDGSLISRQALDSTVRARLRSARVHLAGPVKARDAMLARLRLFCRQQGIELPYRSGRWMGDKPVGMAEAISRAAASRRAHSLLLVSDLLGLADDHGPVLRAVRRAQMRGHEFTVVVPERPVSATAGAHGWHTDTVLARREARASAEVCRQLRTLAVPVLWAGSRQAMARAVGQVMRGGRAAAGSTVHRATVISTPLS